ncbi:hypothetical protein ACWD3J_46005 [Streptomyces sp. NPDC002755]|uniref:hypothetical protein n=1 Tax=Streptomyces sp. NPDC002884 TaxID=3154544 RepID=UPI0033317993
MSATPAVHHGLLASCQPVDGGQGFPAVPAQRKARRSRPRLLSHGRTVVLLLDTEGAAEAQRLLPRLRRAVERSTALCRRAVEAVVLEFSVSPVTEEELGQAQAYLLLDTIVVDDGMDVVLHLTDSCGRHVMDAATGPRSASTRKTR